MKFASKLVILNFILTFTLLQFAQAQTVIRGEVIDRNYREALIGASVIVKGTTDGTVTDFDGVFEIRTRESLPLILLISYVGYAAQEMEISTSDQYVKVQLEEESVTTEVVEVRGQRISEKQKASPLTVESLDVLAIKETAASS
ncbi:MAG TPA: carboxypeptidase-like regulatory domain-containing protein, partial [Saprospiraceae bacterium]|nr:carboxypeptidase-like regulatory domain-containing protein [Saprospiraceae bacterium]